MKKESKIRALFNEMVSNYFQRAFEAKKENKYLIWLGYFLPSELCYAMEMVPFFPEIWGGVCARRGIVLEYLEAAENYGFPRELCSASKGAVGMALSGSVPRPDFFISTSPVCDGGMKCHDFLGRFFKCPTFFIDTPYFTDKESIEYFTNELEGAILFLEEKTKKRLDFDGLKQVIELSKRAADYHNEINEMRKAIHSPIRSGEASGQYFFARNFMGGSIEAVDFYESVFKEVKHRIKSKEVIEEEKYRILWSPLVPQGCLGLLDWIEEEYKASIVMETVNFAPKEKMDPSKPFESLVRKTLQTRFSMIGNGPGEKIIKQHLKIAKEYKIDGVIYFAHWGCKAFMCSVVKMVKDALRDELGIPMVILDGDMWDPRNNPTAQIKTRIEGFFEMLEG